MNHMSQWPGQATNKMRVRLMRKDSRENQRVQEVRIIDDHSKARKHQKMLLKTCAWYPVAAWQRHTVGILPACRSQKIVQIVHSQETAAFVPRCHGGCKSHLPKPQWTSSQILAHNNHDAGCDTRLFILFAAVLSPWALQIPSLSESSATMTCNRAKPALKKIRPGAGSTSQVTSTWPIRLYPLWRCKMQNSWQLHDAVSPWMGPWSIYATKPCI